MLDSPLLLACLCFSGDGLGGSLINAAMVTLAVWAFFKLATAPRQAQVATSTPSGEGADDPTTAH